MTPDMKRLCEAAEDAAEAAIKDSYPHESGTIPSRAIEAAVRAVLMALPDLEGGERYAAGEWSRRNAEAMASDILAEPAKA